MHRSTTQSARLEFIGAQSRQRRSGNRPDREIRRPRGSRRAFAGSKHWGTHCRPGSERCRQNNADPLLHRSDSADRRNDRRAGPPRWLSTAGRSDRAHATKFRILVRNQGDRAVALFGGPLRQSIAGTCSLSNAWGSPNARRPHTGACPAGSSRQSIWRVRSWDGRRWSSWTNPRPAWTRMPGARHGC